MTDLIAALKQETEFVTPYICNTCAENGFSADIHPAISSDDVLIIKVDGYFSTQNFRETHPPSAPDCLIIVKCKEGHYDLYIVELKNVSDIDTIGGEDKIREKFNTCLHDYMSNLLGRYFGGDSIYEFGKIQLHLVTNPFRKKFDVKANLLRYKTQLNMYNTLPYWFRGKTHGLIFDAESPTIRPC